MPTETEKQVYLLAQEHCGLKVGDWVKITRKAEDYEAGWNDTWLIIKDEMVGNIYKISNIDKYGIWIYQYAFPFFILEKVENPTHEFKPFDRVLVKYSNAIRWLPDIFLYMTDLGYKCTQGDVIKCIPYECNEHLIGTSNMPKGDKNE